VSTYTGGVVYTQVFLHLRQFPVFHFSDSDILSSMSISDPTQPPTANSVPGLCSRLPVVPVNSVLEQYCIAELVLMTAKLGRGL